MPKSRERDNNHTSSQVIFVVALYLAADDRDTIFCFLDFHETKEFPRKMQNPLINCLESFTSYPIHINKSLELSC